MLKKSLFGILVLAALMAIFLTPAFAQDAYMIGISMAVTGPGAETYGPIKDALDIYFKEVNAKGGINGHPVRIVIEDDAAQPSKTAANAKKLVTQDKVLFLVNASLSSTYAPMVHVAKQFKVPILFAGGVCPDEVYPPKADPDQYCSTAFGAKYDSRFALSFIKEEAKGPVKLGLVAMNIPVSRGG
jgi:branched-chain amino acid transport system substrate-binding protein